MEVIACSKAIFTSLAWKSRTIPVCRFGVYDRVDAHTDAGKIVRAVSSHAARCGAAQSMAATFRARPLLGAARRPCVPAPLLIAGRCAVAVSDSKRLQALAGMLHKALGGCSVLRSSYCCCLRRRGI